MESPAAMFEEDIVWHTPGHDPSLETMKGRDAVFASFSDEFELSEGSYRFHVHDVLANDDHGVALLRATASRNEKALNMTTFSLLDEGRAGRRGVRELDGPANARRVLVVMS